MLRPLISVALLGLALSACATPTLPLPPPAALTATVPDVDGVTTVEGEAVPDAWVYCINERLEVGVIVRAEGDADPMPGHFTLMIPAASGDYLTLFQEAGTDNGPPTELLVPSP